MIFTHRTWIALLCCGVAAGGCGGSSTTGGGTNHQDGGAGSGGGGAAGTAGTGGGGGAAAGSGGGGAAAGSGGGGGIAGTGGSSPDAGHICGTIAGLTCGSGEWCDYQPSASGKNYCGGDDSGGYCRQKPQGCTADCPGVCGCDGKFYCNACLAHAAGTDDTNDTACMKNAGDGGTGAPCQGDSDCGIGLKCCYPCGTPGCSNQCMPPDSSGQCPAFP